MSNSWPSTTALVARSRVCWLTGHAEYPRRKKEILGKTNLKEKCIEGRRRCIFICNSLSFCVCVKVVPTTYRLKSLCLPHHFSPFIQIHDFECVNQRRVIFWEMMWRLELSKLSLVISTLRFSVTQPQLSQNHNLFSSRLFECSSKTKVWTLNLSGNRTAHTPYCHPCTTPRKNRNLRLANAGSASSNMFQLERLVQV